MKEIQFSATVEELDGQAFIRIPDEIFRTGEIKLDETIWLKIYSKKS